MPIFTESHARIAEKSYQPSEERIDIFALSLKKQVNRSSGYHGLIYQNIKTKDYVVAHTGTEFDTDKFRDALFTDAQMVLLKVNQQLDDARDLVELAVEMAKRDRTSVTVTGHSLGGFLAQVTCHEYGLKGETFNASGAAGLYDVPAGGSQVINHVRATDMVGAANRHFGEVRVYATRQDVDALLQDGPPPSQQNRRELLTPLRRLGPDLTHGAVQFHGGHRTAEQLATYGPNTIISRSNQEIYQQHKAEFDAYRDHIRLAATDMAATFKRTGAGLAYTGMLGSQYLALKVRHGLMGNDVHDETRELRQAAQRTLAEVNRRFVPPAEPSIHRRDGAAHPDIREQVQDLLRPRTLEDSFSRPAPGSGWPSQPPAGSTPAPLSLREDPLAYINRMVAAYDTGDRDAFRQMTRMAAADPFARHVQAIAVTQVDQEEQRIRQQAEQQRQEQTQPHIMTMRGPRLS